MRSIKNMNTEQFQAHLELILNLIQKTEELQETKTITETKVRREQLTNQFMSRILELYLAIKTSSTSSTLSAKYKTYIEKSEYSLRSLISELISYINATEDKLRSTFYDKEWEEIICRRRSAIEALKEMYESTFFAQFYYELDTEDLDDSIEMRAHKEGGLKEEQIPKGIPTSHWWWWSPEEPPNDRNIMNQTVQIN